MTQVNDEIKLAIVVPMYNSERWIGRAIRSVQARLPPNTHIIVIDDGSTDRSLEALREFEGAVIVETGPNLGACHARNRGLRISEELGADLILFLDSDDYLEGDMLYGSIEEAKVHSADMVVSNMHIERSDGTRYERPLYSGNIEPEDFFFGWMAEQGYVNPSGIVWSTKFVRMIGGWDESLSKYQDLDIEMRAMLFKPRIRKNERGAAIHSRVNPNSITMSNSKISLISRYRVINRLLTLIQGTSFEHMSNLLLIQLYNVARASFREGHIEMGREIVELLSANNFSSHPGNWKHGLVASILGLELKVRLFGG